MELSIPAPVPIPPRCPFFISLASSGLSCSTWSSLRRTGSVFATRELLLGLEGSVVASCGRHCSTACGILIPQAGIKPISLALQGGFLTTGPPGKPPTLFSFFSSWVLTACSCLVHPRDPRGSHNSCLLTPWHVLRSDSDRYLCSSRSTQCSPQKSVTWARCRTMATKTQPTNTWSRCRFKQGKRSASGGRLGGQQMSRGLDGRWTDSDFQRSSSTLRSPGALRL